MINDMDAYTGQPCYLTAAYAPAFEITYIRIAERFVELKYNIGISATHYSTDYLPGFII